MTNECRCGRPTRDDAYVCETCADALARALGEIPWLEEELEITITRRQGIDYRRIGGGKGGKTAPRADKRIDGDNTRDPIGDDSPSLGAAIQHDPIHMGASEARTHLKALLVSWALFCQAEDVRHSSPTEGLPEDNLSALSRWLLWRVDGLTLHDIGLEAVDEITSAVAHCHRLIDRPADRQYLGECLEADCSGRMFAIPGGSVARCEACGTTVPADRIRERLLGELDDRLCTAAEIARLSTYLGLKDDREAVRKRINQWSKRGQIAAHASFSDDVTFRFGEVYERLVAAEYGKASA